MNVLIAEDEKKLARFIGKALEEASYQVDIVYNGTDALSKVTSRSYHAAIMDIMMPGRDGLSVLRLMRERFINTPVLILTARGETSERIEGLELGADDYLSKPFAMRELLARVAALTRRGSPDRASLLQLADLTVNLITREVKRAGNIIRLSEREFGLLEFLLRAPGEVRSRTQLFTEVWGHHFDSGTNLVDVYVQRLRRKVDEPYPLKLIHTVRNIGYVLKAPSPNERPSA